jgi:hypothetical protein
VQKEGAVEADNEQCGDGPQVLNRSELLGGRFFSSWCLSDSNGIPAVEVSCGAGKYTGLRGHIGCKARSTAVTIT